MKNVAISVNGIGKQYKLGQIGTGALAHDLNRWWYKVRGKEDPYLQLGSDNVRSAVTSEEYVWALRQIDFEVCQGEVLGIVGRNGAGKSTLLKILSRVTTPTTGNIKVRGRIASLLEVGTGFHPELTGRENIFLNGAILGMRKDEINRKLDEIISFSGVQRYIDTPVKRYSSGMYVRLAFAVAAHLESDILIVDEVLAVGDAEFQKKCLGKMSEVSRGEGRTILFVSHNMSAIQKLCNKGVFLDNGRVKLTGSIEEIVEKYLENGQASQSIFSIPTGPGENPDACATKIVIEDLKGDPINEIPVGKPWQVRIFFTLTKAINHFIVGLGMINSMDVSVRTTWSKEMDLEPGDYVAVLVEDQLMLAVGNYSLILGLSSYERSLHYIENVAFINIIEVGNLSLDKTIIRTSGAGIVLNPMRFEISKLD